MKAAKLRHHKNFYSLELLRPPNTLYIFPRSRLLIPGCLHVPLQGSASWTVGLLTYRDLRCSFAITPPTQKKKKKADLSALLAVVGVGHLLA